MRRSEGELVVRGHLGGGMRAGEEIALADPAPQLHQRPMMGGGLHPLGDHRQT